jgi:putative oxidoreductase
MSDGLVAISRLLLSSVFIALGFRELLDVGTVTNDPGATRFMKLLGLGGDAPKWFGYLIAGFEFFGGLAILLGLWTSDMAWAFVIFLLLITGFVHPFWALEGAQRADKRAHFYKNLAIMGGFLLLAMSGGGRYSLDHMLMQQ